MPKFYQNESSNHKSNAQLNLMGRTHYVDDATLKWHKSRVLETHVIDGGLLFGLIESVPTSFDGHERVFRFSIFDLFGTVVERPKLADSYSTRRAAVKAMWKFVNEVDAQRWTLEAADRAERYFKQEMDELRGKLKTAKAS